MSGSIDITVTIRGQAELEAKFKGATADMIKNLKSSLTPLANSMRAEAKGRIAPSGPKSTGKLAASINTTVVSDSKSISILMYSRGVQYAAIQERGGRVGPRLIMPVRAMVLAYAGRSGGRKSVFGLSFARHVNWPGARIPPKRFMLNTLRANRDKFKEACEAAMSKSLKTDK